MTAAALLESLTQQGVRLWVEGNLLRYDAPKHLATERLLQTLREQKAALLGLLSPQLALTDLPPVSQFPAPIDNRETGKLKSEEGRALLAPFLPVIQAAHRDELPCITVCMGGKEYDLADYICRVSAGIWYGVMLDDTLLPAWLENLRRLQAWYETLPPPSSPAYELDDDGLCWF